jgi:hypothetical protein
MNNTDLQGLAQEIIKRIDAGIFFLDLYMNEKGIDQKTIQDIYQIIREKHPNYIAEYAEGGRIYRIYKKLI